MCQCRCSGDRCLGEGVRPNAAVCMTVFAVPMMIPGITLTIVAFEDETGFSKFSPLHILGMSLLGLAVLLVTTGLLINFSCKTRVTPDDNDDLHSMSTHEKAPKEGNLNGVFSASASEQSYKNNDLPAVFRNGCHPFTHVIQMDHHFSNCDDHSGHLSNSDPAAYSYKPPKEASIPSLVSSEDECFSNKSFEEYTSSPFDSYDSDDRSSGSYIVSGEWDMPVEDSSILSNQDTRDYRSFSTFKTDFLKNPVFNFKEFSFSNVYSEDSNVLIQTSDSLAMKVNDSVNVSYDGVEDEGNEPSYHNRNNFPFQITQNTYSSSGFSSDLQEEDGRDSKLKISSKVFQNLCDSPGHRQRLFGLSSEIAQTSCDSIKIYEFSSDENLRDSNLSVFCKDVVNKSTAIITTTECVAGERQDEKSRSSNGRTWAQSPTTARPHSFPTGTGSPGSSNGGARSSFQNEKHALSLGEFSR